ncbi:MAG: YdbL family protein [Candidatus Omnitrophica bacterium]|nr:YdbL family protein [Candidatus Omnitrophota bacterium]
MKWWLVLGVVSLAACAIVNVYVTFPEEKIKQAADDLLGPALPTPQKPKGQSFFKLQFGQTAWAQEAALSSTLKTSSPILDQIKKRRDSWREKIDEFKAKGYLGETNSFSLVVKETPPASLAAEVAELREKENRERNLMIEELMKINNANPHQEKTFRSIFAEVMIKKYTPEGAWVQQPDGTWIRK